MDVMRTQAPSRAMRWLRRYGPAEVAAVLGAVAGADLAALWWGDGAAIAFGGSIGEAIAFYGFLLVRDLRAKRAGVGVTVRDLVFEFGPAEFVDTLAVRPLAMYLGQLALGSTLGGVIAGKVAADLVFYGLAILSVELRGRPVTPAETPLPEPVVLARPRRVAPNRPRSRKRSSARG
jgi:hypothetical protein